MMKIKAEFIVQFFKLPVLLILIFVANSALAICTPKVINNTVSLSPISINVPRDITPGSPISNIYGPFKGGYSSLGNCGYVPYMFISLSTSLTPSAYPNVYETGHPGVGVRIWTTFIKETFVGNTPTYWYRHNGTGGSANLTSIYIQLYATGPISPGVISFPKPLVDGITSSSASSVVNGAKYSTLTVGNTVNITTQMCEVSNPNQTVELPKISKSDLQSNGPGKYPTSKSFSINLTCNSGLKVSTKFEGTTMSGKNDVLANTSSDNDAVGIQMLYNNEPVIFGTNMAITGSSQTQLTLPFNAYYYYNGGDIKAGPVTSVTTFTFTYN